MCPYQLEEERNEGHCISGGPNGGGVVSDVVQQQEMSHVNWLSHSPNTDLVNCTLPCLYMCLCYGLAVCPEDITLPLKMNE